MHNLILNSDSYKTSHFLQYPPGTSGVSSYVEARGGPHPETLFFGLQAFIKGHLLTPVSAAMVDEADAVITAHGLPFNRAGWQHILDVHDGHLPLRIEAPPEGTWIPIRNVLVQVSNTDPAVPWLTSYIETALMRAIWYPTTVATISGHCRQIIGRYLAATADNLDSLPLKLHDFGARGATSLESAGLGAAAHLVSFDGTDTLAGLVAARDFYDSPMAGVSIPAAEHSTITCWGPEGERDAYANMLEQFGRPGALVSVVSDSWDLWHAIDHIWGVELKEQVETMGGTLVVRPDSGDPLEVVPRVITALRDRFGGHTNSKGYFQLPDHVRVLQGDGVSPAMIELILERLQRDGLSAENVAFGMGGELLQKMNRDTCQFAMKASAARVDGRWRDVWKDPVTDHGKRSKRGILALIHRPNGFETVRRSELAGRADQLRTVYEDGQLMFEEPFAEICTRARRPVG